jgi:predicted AAA+ superfamily ATPase
MASRELKYTDKTIITWDYREDGSINYVPVWKWLQDR